MDEINLFSDYNCIQDKQHNISSLHRIANILLINGGFLDNSGLQTAYFSTNNSFRKKTCLFSNHD